MNALRVMAACITLAAGLARAQAPLTLDDAPRMLDGGHHAKLVGIYVEARADNSRNPAGETKADRFMRILLPTSRVHEAYEVWSTVTRRWVDAMPRSVPAAVAHATTLVELVVLLERRKLWQDIDARLAEAHAVLQRVAVDGQRDPQWHAARLAVVERQGVEQAAARRLAEEALALRFWDQALVLAAVRALQPREARDPAAAMWLARRLLARGDPDASALYALAVWGASGRSAPLLADPYRHGVQWPAINQGFESLAAGKKEIRNRTFENMHAILACLARDRESTARLMARMAHDAAEWERWGGVALYTRCEQWARPKDYTPRTT